MDVRDQFIGIWNLVSWTAVGVDNQLMFPFGEEPIGQIMYVSNGNMMVEIMKKDRQLFASDNLLQGSIEEIVSAYSGFVAYSGTYEIDAKAKHVIHHVTISSFPNWVGQDQVRYFDFRNGLLILKAPAIGTVQHELIWQKKL